MKIGQGNTDSAKLHFDPRPVETRNTPGYASYVRNMIINYKGLHVDSVPLVQLYEPANTYAIEHDHVYLANSASENFLCDILVTDITPEIAPNIEKATRGQAGNPNGYAERCLRMHASKFGAICRARDKQKMAENLVHHVRVQPAAVNHGRLFENTALTQFEQQCNVRVQHGVGMTVSLDKDFI